jgi:hypothetical protein
MQRIHLLGNSDVDALSGDTAAHAVLPDFVSDRKNSVLLSKWNSRGEDVIYIKRSKLSLDHLKIFRTMGINTIVLFTGTERAATLREIKRVRDTGYNVIVVLREDSFMADYVFFTSNTEQEVRIGLPCVSSERRDGIGRFSRVLNLVRGKEWCFGRKHYFYELENPAELTAYSRAFIFRVSQTFTGFISKRCYIDSLVGIQYSPQLGLLHTPMDGEDLLGVSYRHTQQYTVFAMNDSTMRGFAMGKLGSELWDYYKSRLLGMSEIGGIHEYDREDSSGA